MWPESQVKDPYPITRNVLKSFGVKGVDILYHERLLQTNCLNNNSDLSFGTFRRLPYGTYIVFQEFLIKERREGKGVGLIM